jgi:hypothetical protein
MLPMLVEVITGDGEQQPKFRTTCMLRCLVAETAKVHDMLVTGPISLSALSPPTNTVSGEITLEAQLLELMEGAEQRLYYTQVPSTPV